MSGVILTVNAGSSSLKFAVFRVTQERAPELAARGQVEAIGTAPHLAVEDREGKLLSESYWEAARGMEHTVALRKIQSWIESFARGQTVLGVGHRIAHGGPRYAEPVLIDEEVLAELERLVPLVPLHQPHNLAAVRAVAARRPDLPQVACFDTSFHRGRAAVTERLGLPHELYDEGVRRYGFHGISYEYITQRFFGLAPEVARGRVVIAHLGSGSSLCATRNGRSVETTMGFSSLDGVPMGTRCGALDPGVLLYLMQEKRMDAAAIQDLLYRRSGLLGVSGVSNDMRELHRSGDPRARDAIDYFVYRIGQSLGALAAALGGLDALVFTAGIGENDVVLRARVCQNAAWLGIEIDHAANQVGDTRISAAGRTPSVWVIPTDEERMIATHTHRMIAGAEPSTPRVEQP